MKLMKHIMIALVLCAIPAMAVGQTVTCDECSHVVSVYKGHGGFIAMAAEDAEMVTYVASCEGVTRSGELEPNDDGMVSMLLRDDTACYGDDEDNSFEVGPIMDGGWYWITDETNSAVGGLVNKDVLDNEATMIAGAGEGVTMTMGSGAVLLKETATGRVGLLPNILPVEHMDAPAANPCGAAGGGTGTNPFTRKDSECAMGDGGTIVLANYTNSITGGTTRVMDGDTVTRPAGGGTLSITVDLWGNGTGAFLTDGNAGGTVGINFMRGNAQLSGRVTTRHLARYTGVTYTVSAGSGVGGGEQITSGTPVEGVDHAAPELNGDNAVAISIVKSDANCSKTNNFSTPVTVNAVVNDTGAIQVTPTIKRIAPDATPENNTAGTLKFMVACPAASANMGQELVPENPFPTTE